MYFVGPDASALAGHDGVRYIVPQPRVVLPGLSDVQLTLFAMMPRSSYRAPEDFFIAVTDSASGDVRQVRVRFRGP